MPSGKTYKTPQALRTALEARLLELATRTGTDLQRIRRRVAFDRLLARMFVQKQDRPAWCLKGGYAIELRIETARTTKDIDLSIAGREPIAPESLHRMVDDAASLDLADGFVFVVGESILDLDAAPQGGSRFPVQARMAGRPFVGFHVDIGIGDDLIEPTDEIEGEGWFDFAGLPRPEFRMISREQQFAEKLHAYTRPRTVRDNSRVKDLVDLLLLTRTQMEPRRLRENIERTFAHRATHPIPPELAPPPESWRARFAELAAQCSMDVEIDSALRSVNEYVRDL
ncbi:MAG: nucleotidyl transferase AbiEii/AbiGii toxin family protein [Bryobacteraceae bacterium]